MKCSKCGFVSYAGLEQCKKCGYPFVKAAPKASSSLISLFPDEERAVPRPASEPLPDISDPRPEARQPAPPTPTRQARESTLEQQSSPLLDLIPADRSTAGHPSANWREELSERIVNFRKRRARLQPNADSEQNFELDFEDAAQAGDEPRLTDEREVTPDHHPAFDMEIGDGALASGGSQPAEEFEGLDEETAPFAAPSPENKEITFGEPEAPGSPMEILVDFPAEPSHAEEEAPPTLFLAPVGRRFVAGMADALVLLMGAGIFGLILWRVCGRLSVVPLNVVVLGLAAAVVVFAYFAVFTAIASATPGLLWLGCEIRNSRGDPPTVRESCWRAFGVMVSLSALMLGFVWACVDSDGLTWHDRMSGTFITAEPSRTGDLAGLNANP